MRKDFHLFLLCTAFFIVFRLSPCLAQPSSPKNYLQQAKTQLSTWNTKEKLSQLILSADKSALFPFQVVEYRFPSFLSQKEWTYFFRIFAQDSLFFQNLVQTQKKRYIDVNQPLLLLYRADSSLQNRYFSQSWQKAGVPLVGAYTSRFSYVQEADSVKITPEHLHFLQSSSFPRALKSLQKARRKKHFSQEALNTACLSLLKMKYQYMGEKETKPPFSYSKSYKRYDFLHKATLLLRNEQTLLPIRNFDAKTLRWANLSTDSLHVFSKRLHDFVEIPEQKHASASRTTWIIAMDSARLSSQQYTALQTLLESKPANGGKNRFIALYFFDYDHPQRTKLYEQGIHFDAEILLHTLDTDTQDIAAQVLFGALPISAHTLPDTDHTLPLAKQKHILSFISPESLHIDPSRLRHSIDSLVYNAIEAHAFPGAQILAAKNNQVFFYKAYGHHTYDSIRPVRLSDLYDLASITKVAATTTALMSLYDSGRFCPNESARTYFPKWRKVKRKNVNMREILSHQAGLKSWIPYYRNLFNKKGGIKTRYLSRKNTKRYNTPLSKNLYLKRGYKKKIYQTIRQTEVGEKTYGYSDLAFYFFPVLIEELSHTSFTSFLQERFFVPLGASTLGFNPSQRFSLARIVPTEIDTFFRNELLHGKVHDEGAALMGGVSGHAGLFSKAVDLGKLWTMYLNQGKYGDKTYLSKESLSFFTACQFCEEENRRGLGFDKPPTIFIQDKSPVPEDASLQSFGHTGFTGTLAWADPENKLLFIFLSNRVYPSRHQKMIYEKNVRPNIHKALYKAISQP